MTNFELLEKAEKESDRCLHIMREKVEKEQVNEFEYHEAKINYLNCVMFIRDLKEKMAKEPVPA